MQRIAEQSKIEAYHRQFPLTDYFSFDIGPYVSMVRFESEEVILEEGSVPDYLYYVISGRAKLFLSHENGRVSLINFLNAPCFMGEMELLGAQKNANGITAITPCVCYRIHIKECGARILGDVKFLRHLCLFLSEKAIGNTANYSRNQSYPLEARLADFILLTAQNGFYRERHTEASEYLGVTYRHFLYVLAGFVKKGLLRKTDRGYYINDREALRSLAKFTDFS